MPLVDNFHILPEQEELFYKACVKKEQFYGTKIDKKYIVYRTRNFDELIMQSVVPSIVQAWGDLSDYQKSLWTEAGIWSDQSGWDLFAQDTAYRISNDIVGVGEPDIFHQYKVGHLHIEAPATGISIIQVYPLKGALAFDFAINYFSNLQACGVNPYAFLFHWALVDFGDGPEWVENDLFLDTGTIWQWVNDFYDFTDWYILEMYVELEVHNMRGDLYIDGFWLLSNDQNYANDWQCDSIESSWVPVSVPAGASFQSVYSRNSFYYP